MRTFGAVTIDTWAQGGEIILEVIQRTATRSNAVAVALTPDEGIEHAMRVIGLALRIKPDMQAGLVGRIVPHATSSFKPAAK